MSRALSTELKNEMLNHYFKNPNTQTTDLSKMFGMGRSTINQLIRRDSRYIPGSRSRPIYPLRHKKETIEKAMQLCKEGNMSYSEIGKIVGCAGSTVGSWVSRSKQIKEREKKQEYLSVDLGLPEVEIMRKNMFEQLQTKYIELETSIEERTAQLHSIHHKMEVLGEQWN